MRWSWTACAVFCGCVAAAPAGELIFDGETYHLAYQDGSGSQGVAEFLIAGETMENWTKLVAVRRFAGGDDPDAAAAQMAKSLRQNYPDAKFQLLTRPDGSEAMIDFIIWPADHAYAELNIHLYRRVSGHVGLESHQFAYRFTDASPDAVEQFKAQRQAWLEMLPQANIAWPENNHYTPQAEKPAGKIGRLAPASGAR